MKNSITLERTLLVANLFLLLASANTAVASDLVHDAEYYVLQAQHGQRWEIEDGQLDARLTELRAKHGAPPNIIHIMWDDTSYGDVGIPAISKIRGFETPNINRMAAEGILFSRMYTEVGCTPSRAAVLTGRLAVRNGMYTIGFPIEYSGMRAEEITTAEVLSQAGYATAFYGKLHLGDIEENYPHNQGFDETLFSVYNQVASLYNPIGEGANGVIGLVPDNLVPNPYQLDDRFTPEGFVLYIEGQKGELGKEWRGTSHDDYWAAEKEFQTRSLDFIRRSHAAGKPFFLANWPLLTSFIPSPQKTTVGRGIYTDTMQNNVDAFIGQVMELLEELEIADNTLLVVMADNGPMAHNPPPGLGMVETLFRGGKGDFLEGGVRVPAFAWWPGVIEPGQIVGDIIHEVDLHTTFTRLGGVMDKNPDDRVIDGIDQTALLLNGDTHGRRDYVHIYTGPILAATVKGDYKRHWVSGDPTDASGIGAAFYFLPLDTREKSPMLANMIHFQEAFKRMVQRHELLKKKYPDAPRAHGPAYGGLTNARPETLRVNAPPANLEDLPFDPSALDDVALPWYFTLDPDYGE